MTRPPELSEQELSELLDSRDREQELKRRSRGRWVSISVGAFLLVATTMIFSFKESRELVTSLFKDTPPPPSAPAGPSHPAETSEAVSDQMQNAKNLMDFMQLGKGSAKPEKK